MIFCLNLDLLSDGFQVLLQLQEKHFFVRKSEMNNQAFKRQKSKRKQILNKSYDINKPIGRYSIQEGQRKERYKQNMIKNAVQRAESKNAISQANL